MQAGDTTFGSWVSAGDPGMAEVMGTAGFDWLVVDSEHSPYDIRGLRDQLIALEASPSEVILRVPVGETWIIKQVLDIGAQTVMVPMVESAAQARELVRACTYPPHGTRGVGAAGARATRFSAIEDYVTSADAQISLLVQVESRAGLAALDDILAVEGVDGVFIGPADLSSDMGFAGNAAAPEVHATICDMLGRIRAAGKAAGVMSLGDLTDDYLRAGAHFVAVAIDVRLLALSARALAAKWCRKG
jgi:4-hydroxy-2-oxoheptanedioate aldolase